MNKGFDSKTVFKFLDAKQLVRRVTPNPTILLVHNSTMSKWSLGWYNLTTVELKTFTFSAGSKSLSLDKAVLGPIPKRLPFTMVKNTDFIGSLDSNPYRFPHYNISDFSLFVNGKQFPTDSLYLGMDHFCHGLQDAFRSVGHVSLELGTTCKTRYAYKRRFHFSH